MSIDLRMPNITGVSEREQLSQIRSYLYQFIPQLQWALNNMDTSSQSQVTQQIVNKEVKTNAPVSAEATFNSIKSLIIKSADIVNAYYEEVSKRLEGLYVAESDFGTYVEETSKTINETSTKTEQNFENLQTIISDIEGFGTKTILVNASVKTGLLYYLKDGNENMQEGTPIYGVEVGQRVTDVNRNTVFDKFARFTANRLSFYDQNQNEVAYVSDNKLLINSMEITAGADYKQPAYKIGGYADYVTEGRGIVNKWVGGNA
jgi:hypothetical protein